MEDSFEEFTSLKEFENAALNKLKDPGKFYFCAGASSSSIPRDNEEALERYRIQPRVLRDVSNASLQCKILDKEMSCPIGIAPTGFHFFAHELAELATIRGCAKEHCIFIMSTVSSTCMEEVEVDLELLDDAPTLWMQVYITKDRDVTRDIIDTASDTGFSALVVTVDSPISGQWKNKLPEGFVNSTKDKYANVHVPIHTLQDDTVTFEDLKWLKCQTNLPIIVKGIMNGEDAVEAVRCGASAIYVSNHGGRQIEKVVPTVEVLEEVVDAVKDYGTDVYFDGGIRSGTDIFIALALGAKAVFIGRPAVWGLASGGEEGVRRVLRILKDQLLSTMKLAGVNKLEDIHRRMVRKL